MNYMKIIFTITSILMMVPSTSETISMFIRNSFDEESLRTKPAVAWLVGLLLLVYMWA